MICSELIVRSAHDALPTMEPDHVNETPTHDFTLVAVHGDIERRPCRPQLPTSSEPARRVWCVQPSRSHTGCFQDGFARTPVVATSRFSEGMHLSRGTQIRLVGLSIDVLSDVTDWLSSDRRRTSMNLVWEHRCRFACAFCSRPCRIDPCNPVQEAAM